MAQYENFGVKALFSPAKVFVLSFLLFRKVIKLLVLLPLGFNPRSLLNKTNNICRIPLSQTSFPLMILLLPEWITGGLKIVIHIGIIA